MPEMQQRSRFLSTSTSSAPTSNSTNNLQPDPHEPSSIPPWVHVNDGNEEPEISLLLPPTTKPNTRHYKPPPSHYKPGRKWDHLRSAEPPLLSAPIADHQVRWAPFMQSGPNPGRQMGEGRIASPQWMEENMPYTSTDWDPEDEVEPAPGLLSARGLMYRGKWLISPQRQEKTVRFFWVSILHLCPMVWKSCGQIACLGRAYPEATAGSSGDIVTHGVAKAFAREEQDTKRSSRLLCVKHTKS